MRRLNAQGSRLRLTAQAQGSMLRLLNRLRLKAQAQGSRLKLPPPEPSAALPSPPVPSSRDQGWAHVKGPAHAQAQGSGLRLRLRLQLPSFSPPQPFAALHPPGPCAALPSCELPEIKHTLGSGA